MSKVMFKLRCVNPNLKSTPSKNKAHIKYIGKRSGVKLSHRKNHGLFGNIKNMDNINDIANYVEKKSKEKTNIYRAIISLKEEDAMKLGFDKRKTWEQMIEQQMPEIARELGISVSNLEYAAAVHYTKGHPHAHIVFFDKNQSIKSAYIHPKKADNIRKNLIKNIFKDELIELYKGRDGALKEMTTEMEADLRKFYPTKPLGKMMDSSFSPSEINNAFDKLTELEKKIPRKGRMSYKLMPAEIKEDINSFIRYMISTDIEIKKASDECIRITELIAEYYSSDEKFIESEKNKAIEDIYNKLGNKVLTAIKEVRLSADKKNFENHLKMGIIQDLYMGCFQLLTQMSEEKENRKNERVSDLSKQAKKEFAMKQKNASQIEWEQER